jgi:hypothetical protein
MSVMPSDRAAYEAYRERVIQACVDLMGERVRSFFTTQCSFEEEFASNEDPDQVAINQQESMD